MPIQEIMKLKTIEDEKIKMALLLAMHCAPIMKGIKAANIITVDKREFSQIGHWLEGTSISYRFLKTRGEKAVLYLYRKEELEQYLFLNEIQLFLKEFGYETTDLETMLNHLSERICLYRDGNAEFPHEIGIFLEYPLMDVKGFLENNGKNFVFSGYWKVYHDVQGAARRFEQYDRERDDAIKEVISGKTIKDIIV